MDCFSFQLLMNQDCMKYYHNQANLLLKNLCINIIQKLCLLLEKMGHLLSLTKKIDFYPFRILIYISYLILNKYFIFIIWTKENKQLKID